MEILSHSREVPPNTRSQEGFYRVPPKILAAIEQHNRTKTKKRCSTTSSRSKKMCFHRGNHRPIITKPFRRRYFMIKRVEVNYRVSFRRTWEKDRQRHRHDRQPHDRTAFSNSRYSDAPERNGIPCTLPSFPGSRRRRAGSECGAKLEIDDANISVVLDDTMCKGVEPWDGTACGRSMRWSRTAACSWFQEKTGRAAQVHRQETLQLSAGDPRWRRQSRRLWVNKDDLTHERILGGIAAIDPAVISIEAVEAYLLEKTKDKRRRMRRGQRTNLCGRRPNLHGEDGDAERRNRVDA